MAETLLITSTRNSPYELKHIGYADGDLTTLKALAEDIISNKNINTTAIPINWIQKYAKENGSEISEILDMMIKEWKG
jgi:hypothetical protein